MNKKLAIILTVLVLFIAGPANADEVTINENTGFEKMTGSMPAGWYLVGILKPEVEFSADSQVKYSGNYSAKTTVSQLTSRLRSFGPPNWAQDITKGIPAGKKIRLTAYVKTEGVEGIAPVAIQCWNKEKIVRFGTTQHKFPIGGTTDWQKVSFEMEVPEDTVKIRILCMLSGTGTAWFDDVKIKVIP